MLSFVRVRKFPSNSDAEDEFQEDILDYLSNAQLSGSLEKRWPLLIRRASKLSTGDYEIRAICQSRANLAGTSVNALVNADFSNNKLMVEAEEIAALNTLALGIRVRRQWKRGYHEHDLADPRRAR